MKNSDNLVAIITGASRGLGLATARALSEKGWHLIVDARNAGDLQTSIDSFVGEGAVTVIAGDVTDAAHRRQLAQSAQAAGRLDLVINNASVLGPSPQPPLAGYPLDILQNVLEVNAVAPLALIQETLPLLRSTGGTVVNITSDAAVEQYAGWGGYGASKAALDQITNILVVEEPDVSVYSFDPGDMNTRMHQEAFPGEDISDRPAPEDVVPALVALIERRPPSGRYSASDLRQPA